MFSVYKHTFPNGKIYIGITKQTTKMRWRNGYSYKAQKLMWNAIQKYGWENIKHEIIADGLTQEEACQMEIDLIKQYDSTNREKGYNISFGGEKVGLNLRHSEETKRKIGIANKGKNMSEEQKEHLRLINTGKKASIETREKLSAMRKGEKCYWFNKNHTEETKDKISLSKTGKPHIITEETKTKISKTLTGRKLSVIKSTKQHPILCVESNKIYNSLADASRELNIDRSSICAVCNGRKKRAKGLTFRYLTEEEKQQWLNCM